MARAEVMARPTRRSAEVRAREASAEREAARLRASGMALIDKGRFFGGAGVFESAKAARKFRLPLLPRDPRRPRPTKKWKSLLKAAAKFCDESVESDHATMELDPPVEKNFISATIADDDEGGWEVLVLGYEWRRGRPKFKYIIIERETGERSTGFKTDAKTATRGGGGSKNHKDSNPPLRGVTGSVAAFLPAVAGVLPLLRGVTGSVTAFLPAWTGFQGPIKIGNIYIYMYNGIHISCCQSTP